MGWRPIAEAPIKPFDSESWIDGGTPRLLLLVNGGVFVTIGRYSYTHRGKGRWLDDAGYVIGPTHFMELPSVPKEGI